MGSVVRQLENDRRPVLIPSAPAKSTLDAMPSTPANATGTSLPATLLEGVVNRISSLRAESETQLVDTVPPVIDEASAEAEASHAAALLPAFIEAEIEAIKSRAFAESYAAGEEEGRQVWARDNARLAALIAQIDGTWAARIDETEELAIEIAFAALTRLLGQALSSREGIIAAVRTALADAKESRAILQIRLSPHDFEFLGEEGRAFLKVGRTAVECTADARIKLGGCLIEAEHGTLDGRLEIQLERLKEALLDARRNAVA